MTFDQNLARGGEKAQIGANLAHFNAQGIAGFAYAPHASFMVLGRSKELVNQAEAELISRSGLPQSRLIRHVAERSRRRRHGAWGSALRRGQDSCPASGGTVFRPNAPQNRIATTTYLGHVSCDPSPLPSPGDSSPASRTTTSFRIRSRTASSTLLGSQSTPISGRPRLTRQWSRCCRRTSPSAAAPTESVSLFESSGDRPAYSTKP